MRLSMIAMLAAALALAGCDQPRGADGYVFGEPEFTRTDMRLEVVLHENLRSLRSALPAGHVETGREAMAWGRVYPDEARCEVHILHPARSYRPEWIGHEIAHCIHGRWHD